MLLFKLIIVLLLIFIMVSLFTALYYMVKSPDNAATVVKSLTIRISLSLFLLFLILVGAQFGLIEPHGFGE